MCWKAQEEMDRGCDRGSGGDGSTDVEKESTGQGDMGSDCEAGSGPKWSVTPKWMDGL